MVFLWSYYIVDDALIHNMRENIMNKFTWSLQRYFTLEELGLRIMDTLIKFYRKATPLKAALSVVSIYMVFSNLLDSKIAVSNIEKIYQWTDDWRKGISLCHGRL